MEFDILLRLLNEKIVSLKNDVERAEKSKNEIAYLQDIIRKIKDDPYSLYTSVSNNIIGLLGYNKEQLEEIEKWKKIYGLYVQFGMDEDAIPQISIVDEGTKRIEEDLERKVMLLSDAITKQQAIILGCQSYEALLGEVQDNDAYITEVEALLDLLNGSDLEVSERNKVKRAVIARNNFVYHKTREIVLEEQRKAEETKKVVQDRESVTQETEEDKDVSEIEVNVNVATEKFDSEEEREIFEINKQLEKRFGKCTVEKMQELVRTIMSCENVKQINELLDGFRPSYGEKYLETVNGLMLLVKVDILTAQYIADDSALEKYNKTFAALEEYKDSISQGTELEPQSPTIDLEGLKDFEKALQEYDSNPLSSKNQVVFLHNAVGRDISDIEDKETLQDIFVLIEKFKKGEKEAISIKDLSLKELKPNKKHRQARILLLHISNNLYGVALIHAKKRNAFPYRMLKSKEAKGLEVVKNIETGKVSMTDLVDYTAKQMDKLVAKISTKADSMKGELA